MKAGDELLIKVGENEFKQLLDRQKVLGDIKEHLTPWLGLIRDVVNYGSNLIPRCVMSSDRKLKDAVVLTILLRQAVAMLDGTEVLLSNGAVHAANLQLRALFEAAVYLEWMLAGDTEQKAIYYYVHNLRRKRLWAMRTQAGSIEATEFVALMAKPVQITDEQKLRSKEQIQDIDRVLARPRFASANKDFDEERKKRRLRHDPAWHAPLGPKSLATIAQQVGRMSLYVLLYSSASEVMHSSSYEQHIRIEEGKLTLHPIRYLEDFGTVFHFSVSIAMYLYRRVLEEYRPEELAAFSRKYIDHWQKQYLNFVKVRYNEV